MEDSNFSAGAWSGHSFKDAKDHYKDHARRSYATATAKGVSSASLVPDRIKTDSVAPLVVMVDVTGSMGDWPTVIFSKLGYLDIETGSYLGEDFAISFAAVGDAYSDKYPVQVRPFKKGTELKTELEGLVVEGGGGGSAQESYELGALYYARNAEMPNAGRPIFIFIADEEPYPEVPVMYGRDKAKVELERALSVDEVFAELKAKFSVYLIHKKYTGKDTRSTWINLLGEERVIDLQDPGRVVDVIFGILAQETDKVDYFHKEIEGRQSEEQVDVVYKALKTVHRPDRQDTGSSPSRHAIVRRPGMSRMHGDTGGKKGEDLL